MTCLLALALPLLASGLLPSTSVDTVDDDANEVFLLQQGLHVNSDLQLRPERKLATWREHPRLLSLLPSACLIAVVLLGLWGFERHCGQATRAHAARSHYVLLNFFGPLIFSCVVLDSHDLCKSLGLSQADSGRMVGNFMVGDSVGTLVAWLFVRLHPEHWRTATRTGPALSFLLWLPCSVLYCYVAAVAGNMKEPATSATGLARVLMLSRAVAGVGWGSFLQFGLSSLMHITPLKERTGLMSWWALSFMLAFGAGPLLSAAMHGLDFSGTGPGFVQAGWLQLIAAFTFLFVALRLPSLAELPDCQAPANSKAEQGSRVVVCACMLLTFLRGFGVSATEVGLALVWEVQYHWDQRLTGLVTGAVLLNCIPVKSVQSRWGQELSVVAWVRVLTLASILGALLFFQATSPLFCGHAALRLVLGGALLFPCLFLSDALCASLMYQHVLPLGSIFDADHAAMASTLVQGVGRFLGPWLGRLLLERKGEDGFALVQLLVICFFLLTFEVVVRPCISPAVLQEAKQPQQAAALLSGSQPREQKIDY